MQKGAGWAAVGLAATGLVMLYADVLSRLVGDWANDDNYSHGFLIIPLSLYFVWERRDRLRALAPRPSALGLLGVAAGMGMLIVGVLGAELFVTRVSLIVTLAGGIVFLWGWPALRLLAFPVLFLVLMVPIPAIVFNLVAFPLQLLASRVGEVALSTAGIPVLREGNVIILANTTLEVAEACSGIRSLISLVTLGLVYGYFTDPRPFVRAVIALSSVPIAIVTNAARVAGTGIAAHFYGREAAEGFFHSFSGWIVFTAAFLLVFLVARLIVRIAPSPHPVVGPATS